MKKAGPTSLAKAILSAKPKGAAPEDAEPEEADEGEEYGEGAEDAALELASALKGGDAKAILAAFANLKELC